MGPLLLGGICLALVSLVSGICPDSCGQGFGSPNDVVQVTETGNFKVPAFSIISKTEYTAMPIIESGELKDYFEVTSDDDADTWVLEVKPFTEYDKGEITTGLPLTFSYVCCNTLPSKDVEVTIVVFGENTQPPIFSQPDGYSGEIAKGLDLGYTLDSVPGDPKPFLIMATDSDYVSPDYNFGSSNVVECSAKNGDVEDKYFSCSTKMDTEGSYDIILTLIKSFQDFQEDSYTFTVIASDMADPKMSSIAPVTLNFKPEDLNPPEFTKYIYDDIITSVAQTIAGYSFELGISATDEDPAGVEYSILSDGNCLECFTLEDGSLRLKKDLDQETLKTGIVTAVIQAKEVSGTRWSTAVVNIKVVGDMKSPKLDQPTYSISIDEDSTISDHEFIASDEDEVIITTEFTFSPIWDPDQDLSDCVTISQTGDKAELTLNPNGLDCLQQLGTSGLLAFLVKVADKNFEDKFGQSLVTLSFPPATTTTADGPSTTTTETTTMAETTTTASETTTCPVSCPTTDPEATTTECPTTTTDGGASTTCPICPTTPRPGACVVDIKSGDFGLKTAQHLGYPDFVDLQNSVRMPLGKVEATCGARTAEVQFSLEGSDHFYIDSTTGEIFPVNNNGLVDLTEISEEQMTFTVHATVDADSQSVQVTIDPLEKSKILVLDSDSDMSSMDKVLEDLNGRNSSVWFRLINIQPREASRSTRDGESLLFLTAFAEVEDSGHFLDRGEATAIVGELDGLNPDDDIEIDHQRPEPETDNEDGASTATIVLAVLLALLILGILVVLLFLNRRAIMSWIKKRRESKDKILDSENSSGKEDIKPKSRNSHGLFNLQSVTVQTSTQPRQTSTQPASTQPHNTSTQQATTQPRSKTPALSGAAQTRAVMQREMSTELEKTLEARQRDRPIQVRPLSNAPPSKGRAPTAPRPSPPAPTGITFNPVAEVVEVEKRLSRTSVSSQGSGTSDSSSDSSSGSSTTSNDEETTRI